MKCFRSSDLPKIVFRSLDVALRSDTEIFTLVDPGQRGMAKNSFVD